jgi:hypothetical protein
MVQIIQARPPARHPRVFKIMRVWRKQVREQLLSLALTIQLLILFVMPAVRTAGLPLPHIVIRGALLTFGALALALARGRGAMAMVILSVALVIPASIWNHEPPNLVVDTVDTVGQVLPQLTFLWIISTAVFGRGRATYHRILGAVVLYLGIGMIFVSLDILLAGRLQPPTRRSF